MRGIGPSIINSLFSLSIEKGYFGGYLVYYVLLLLAIVSIYVGPHETPTVETPNKAKYA
jgi:hypothetical protein